MTLSTLYDFLRDDLLGNVFGSLLSTLLVAGAGYTVKKLRPRPGSQNEDTDQPDN